MPSVNSRPSRCWRSRSTWYGAISASCRLDMVSFSPSAAMSSRCICCNNGMTGFAVVCGWPIGQKSVVIAMAVVSVLALGITLLGCRMLLASRFGVLMIAARDDEMRLRTLGYETQRLKLVVWCLSALIAALAGMLYVPQVGIINPRLLAPELSLEIAVWVAIGGRGHLIGAVIGAVLVNAIKFWLSAAAPEPWPFILSGLIILVVLVFPHCFFHPP